MKPPIEPERHLRRSRHSGINDGPSQLPSVEAAERQIFLAWVLLLEEIDTAIVRRVGGPVGVVGVTV